MFENIDERLQKELPQHIRWRILVTKDTCYIGKVLKIIFTNHSTDGPQHDTSILDLRYSREQIVACIPLQPTLSATNTTVTNIDAFNEYLNSQLYLIIQTVKDTFNNNQTKE